MRAAMGAPVVMRGLTLRRADEVLLGMSPSDKRQWGRAATYVTIGLTTESCIAPPDRWMKQSIWPQP